MDGYVLSAARNINFIHANKNEKETKKEQIRCCHFYTVEPASPDAHAKKMSRVGQAELLPILRIST